MKLLIDTHVFLWMQTDPKKLGTALDLVQDASTDLILSAASSWEIAIKWALGKLALPESPRTYVPTRMNTSAVRPLPVTHEHALGVTVLPLHHRDPFDRLLVSQAGYEGLPILTADPQLRAYDVELVFIR